MAVAQNVSRAVQQNAPDIGGGVVGVGAPVALREFADVQNGKEVSLLGDEPDSPLSRATRPSVIWGVGAGMLSGLLWALDVGPSSFRDFYLTHTLTGIPTGVASALLPKTAAETSGSSQATPQRPLNEARPSRSRGISEFAPADGQTPDTTPSA